jgi:hypothetical protein
LTDENLFFQFSDAEQFAFLFENVHLLLVAYKRDNAKFLFRIESHEANGTLNLAYPGEVFTNRVLDLLENILFIQVHEEGGAATAYVLGSYFDVEGQMYGAYYERDVQHQPTVVLFKVEGEAPDQMLEVPSEAEYERAAAAFSQQHADLVEINEANGR